MSDPATTETADGRDAPQPRAVALSASLAAPPFLPLQEADGKTDHLADALAAMSEIAEGEAAFIRASFRTADRFGSEAQAWMEALKAGDAAQQPSAASRAATFAGRVAAFALRYLAWEFTREGRYLGRKRAPVAPWRVKQKATATVPLTERDKEALKHAEGKAREGVHFEVALRVGACGIDSNPRELREIARGIADRFAAFNTRHQALTFHDCDEREALVGYMPVKPAKTLILSPAEMAAITHPPDDLTAPHGLGIRRALVKPLEPSGKLEEVADPLAPPKGVIPVGVLNAGSEDARIVGIQGALLDRHMAVFGQTGTGKSELLTWLIFGACKAGGPVIVLDPHGSMAKGVLRMLAAHCPERAKDVVLCDFAADEWPLALNPLDVEDADQIEARVASVMEMLLGEPFALSPSATPRAWNYARLVLQALGEANLSLGKGHKLGLLHVTKFLVREEFRWQVMNFVENATAREAFNPDNGTFERLSEAEKNNHIAALLRGFQQLESQAPFARCFAASEDKLDFPALIAAGKIVLLDLGRFGAGAKLGELVGRMVLPLILSSMGNWGRKRDPYTGAVTGSSCRLFVDEAAALLSRDSSVVTALAEARKYDLGVALASQYPSALDKPVLEAILNNTAHKITLALPSGGLSGFDRALSDTRVTVTEADVNGLPNFHGYANVLVEGEGGARIRSGPFAFAALAPAEVGQTDETRQRIERIVERSRALVAYPKDLADARRGALVEDAEEEMIALLKDRAPAIDKSVTQALSEHDLHLDEDPLDGPASDELEGYFDWQFGGGSGGEPGLSEG